MVNVVVGQVEDSQHGQGLERGHLDDLDLVAVGQDGLQLWTLGQ